MKDIDKQIEKEKRDAGQVVTGTAPQPADVTMEDLPEHILTTGIEARFSLNVVSVMC